MLLISTISANHSQSIDYLMLFYRIYIVALVTSEGSTAACISYPSKVVLVMIAGTFEWQLFIFLHLKLLNKRIEVLDTIVSDVHVREAAMTVQLQSF